MSDKEVKITKTKKASKPKKVEVCPLPPVFDESTSTPLEVLKKYYGHNSFRSIQEDVIKSIISGKDTVALLPTGLGKSAVLKIPALIGKGISIIVSPLIALMDDQGTNDLKDNISSVVVNSTIGVRNRRKYLEWIKDGKVKIVYAAPETLLSEKFQDFVEVLSFIGVDYLLVDEAHTCSQWSDFRPAYTQVGKLRELFPDAPMLAVTATADKRVTEDIRNHCDLAHDFALFQTSFDRPNISYTIQYSDNQFMDLLTFIEKEGGTAKGVIYCQSRERTETLSKHLNGIGYKSVPYHAGMNKTDRFESQRRFKEGDRADIIVCTSAFGMGVDLPNIRYVVMYDAPDSFEALSQGWGRGGRDGLPTNAYLMFNKKSYSTSVFLLSNSTHNPKRLQMKVNKLNDLYAYLRDNNTCRRVGLLKAFSQDYGKDTCGNCDVCWRF